jgi:hypothetical protein
MGANEMSDARYEKLLGNLSIAVNRDHARRHRRLVWVAAVAAALLAAAAVAAATQQPPWWESGTPPVNPKVVNEQLAPIKGESFPPSADRSRARTVAELKGATLVAAPVAKDGYCMVPALPREPDIGSSCEYQLTDEVRSYSSPGKDPRWIIYGRLTDERAATLDMSDAVGASLQVKLQPGGFFIADLPAARWSALDDGTGAAKVLSGSGKTLATVCLAFGPSPSASGAGATRVPSPLNAPPCSVPEAIPGKPVLSDAQKLVATTLAHDFSVWKAGTTVALWQAPDAGGKDSCEFLAPVPVPLNDPLQIGLTGCGADPGTLPPGKLLTVGFSSGLAHGSYEHLVDGSTDASSGIVRVEVQMPGHTQPLDFVNDHFLGDFAPTAAIHVADAFVVGFDASGKEVARAPLSPH